MVSPASAGALAREGEADLHPPTELPGQLRLLERDDDRPAIGRALPLPLLVLEAMRPKQWIKNGFVLAGVLFAGKLTDPSAVALAVAAAAAFCLASAATYLMNDARDAESDRSNPRTASRPIARGDLSPTAGFVAAALAALVALTATALINGPTFGAVGAYLALQVAYSHGLKRVLFLDVMCIAIGFVLRAVAGGLAISVPVSSWLLLCTGLLALFLGFTKRRGEALAIMNGTHSHRHVMNEYSLGMLDQLIALVTPATLVAYALYAATGTHGQWMLLTVPFVLYGIFRVVFLTHHRPALAEEPAVVVWRDRPLLVCVLLWATSSAVIAALSTGVHGALQ